MRRLLIKTLGLALIIAGSSGVLFFLILLFVAPQTLQNLLSNMLFLWVPLGIFCVPVILFGLKLSKDRESGSNKTAMISYTQTVDSPSTQWGEDFVKRRKTVPSPLFDIIKNVIYSFAAVTVGFVSGAFFIAAISSIMASVIFGLGFGGIGPDGPGSDIIVGLMVATIYLCLGYMMLLAALVVYRYAKHIAPSQLRM